MKSQLETVAKYGGTSMAHVERVARILETDEGKADVVVVSAPGVDSDNPVKTTDMLLRYGGNPTEDSIQAIQNRFAYIADRVGGEAVRQIVDEIPRDIQSWQDKGDPIAALGEYWSARIFAAMTGRQFVDARDVIIFDGHKLDEQATNNATRHRLAPGNGYAIPGFYGQDKRTGAIRLLERGGSDITGALIARGLGG